MRLEEPIQLAVFMINLNLSQNILESSSTLLHCVLHSTLRQHHILIYAEQEHIYAIYIAEGTKSYAFLVATTKQNL